MCLSNGSAHWILPHEIPTPPVADLIKVLHRGCVPFKWISPLDTSMWNPTPSVADLIRVLHRGCVPFKWISPLDTSMWNPTPSVTDLIKVLHRGCVPFKWITPLDAFTWNPYTPCGRFNQSVAQRMCAFQMDQPIGFFHMKSLHPLWQI